MVKKEIEEEKVRKSEELKKVKKLIVENREEWN